MWININELNLQWVHPYLEWCSLFYFSLPVVELSLSLCHSVWVMQIPVICRFNMRISKILKDVGLWVNAPLEQYSRMSFRRYTSSERRMWENQRVKQYKNWNRQRKHDSSEKEKDSDVYGWWLKLSSKKANMPICLKDF